MKVLRFFVWSLIYAIVLITVGELYLRFTNYDPRSPLVVDNIYGWRHPKNQFRKSDENPNVTEHTDAYGRRRSRIDDTKRKYHVAFLGDSYTYGAGVADEDTFVWKLNERFPDISFDNYAICGYGPYQNLLELRDILAKDKPDYVFFVVWRGSLLRNIYNQGSFTGYAPCVDLHNGKLVYYKPMVIPKYLQKLYILSFLHRVKLGLKSTYCVDSDLDFSLKTKTIFALILQQIHQECLAHNTPLLLILLTGPHSYYFNDNYSTEIPMLDIGIPELNGPHDYGTYRVMHNPMFHPNEAAHQIWADRITDYIRSHHLLQQK